MAGKAHRRAADPRPPILASFITTVANVLMSAWRKAELRDPALSPAAAAATGYGYPAAAAAYSAWPPAAAGSAAKALHFLRHLPLLVLHGCVTHWTVPELGTLACACAAIAADRALSLGARGRVATIAGAWLVSMLAYPAALAACVGAEGPGVVPCDAYVRTSLVQCPPCSLMTASLQALQPLMASRLGLLLCMLGLPPGAHAFIGLVLWACVSATVLIDTARYGVPPGGSLAACAHAPRPAAWADLAAAAANPTLQRLVAAFFASAVVLPTAVAWARREWQRRRWLQRRAAAAAAAAAAQARLHRPLLRGDSGGCPLSACAAAAAKGACAAEVGGGGDAPAAAAAAPQPPPPPPQPRPPPARVVAADARELVAHTRLAQRVAAATAAAAARQGGASHPPPSPYASPSRVATLSIKVGARPPPQAARDGAASASDGAAAAAAARLRGGPGAEDDYERLASIMPQLIATAVARVGGGDGSGKDAAAAGGVRIAAYVGFPGCYHATVQVAPWDAAMSAALQAEIEEALPEGVALLGLADDVALTGAAAHSACAGAWLDPPCLPAADADAAVAAVALHVPPALTRLLRRSGDALRVVVSAPMSLHPLLDVTLTPGGDAPGALWPASGQLLLEVPTQGAGPLLLVTLLRDGSRGGGGSAGAGVAHGAAAALAALPLLVLPPPAAAEALALWEGAVLDAATAAAAAPAGGGAAEGDASAWEAAVEAAAGAAYAACFLDFALDLGLLLANGAGLEGYPPEAAAALGAFLGGRGMRACAALAAAASSAGDDVEEGDGDREGEEEEEEPLVGLEALASRAGAVLSAAAAAAAHATLPRCASLARAAAHVCALSLLLLSHLAHRGLAFLAACLLPCTAAAPPSALAAEGGAAGGTGAVAAPPSRCLAATSHR